MQHPHATADILTSVPGIRHGFLSRAGGVSEGIYAGLNCGAGSNDDADRVTENRARAARLVDAPSGNLRTVYQIHSAEVADADTVWSEPPRADAIVCTRANIAVGVLAADCAPVLFADPEAGVIAAAHAGWRGALGGVIEATVTAMTARGAVRERISAAVGPCIGAASYEVGPEFPGPFLDDDAGNTQFFTPRPGSDRFLFDLAAYVQARLAAAGIERTTHTGQDTYADENFFSYRRSCHRNEPDYGRNISLIARTDEA
jgi:YfiH family protein